MTEQAPGGFISIWVGADWEHTKPLLEVSLPAETAVCGLAVGCSFALERR